MATLRVHGKTYQVEAELGTPLLWVLRDHLGLTGTKYGCGIAQCGACTVHVDGTATRSCVLPLSAVLTHDITTIEGLSSNAPHPVQQAWIAHDVPQCGDCQSGQIMAAAALLARHPQPSDSDIDREMTNICRCRYLSAHTSGHPPGHQSDEKRLILWARPGYADTTGDQASAVFTTYCSRRRGARRSTPGW